MSQLLRAVPEILDQEILDLEAAKHYWGGGWCCCCCCCFGHWRLQEKETKCALQERRNYSEPDFHLANFENFDLAAAGAAAAVDDDEEDEDAEEENSNSNYSNSEADASAEA